MKAPKVKAVLVGTHHEYWHASKQGVCLILPADAESYERMVNQAHEAIAKDPDYQSIAHHQYLDLVGTVFRAIGITPRTGKGRK